MTLHRSGRAIALFHCRVQPALLTGQGGVVTQRQGAHAFEGQKEKPRLPGNPHYNPYDDLRERATRWKHLWLLMMKRKAEIEGEEPPVPRSDQVNWNYDAELQAFSHRLQIKPPADVLQTAFIEPVHSTETETNNQQLVAAGDKFMLDFLNIYIKEVFPGLPNACREACIGYLTSEDAIGDIAHNLGFTDLVQAPEFPCPPASLKRCFTAVLAAIIEGPGGKLESAKFIQDFVVTKLVDKDIVHDIWRPQNPMGILSAELAKRGRPLPDVRLLKRSGVTSVNPVYFVGIFCDKELVSESGGETIIKAEMDAAKLALKKLYGVSIDEYLPRFDVLDDRSFTQKVEALDFNIEPCREPYSQSDATNGHQSLEEKKQRRWMPLRLF